MKRLYEAYLVRTIKVKVPGSTNAFIILEEDTKVSVDPQTHLVYFKQYEVPLHKMAYRIVT